MQCARFLLSISSLSCRKFREGRAEEAEPEARGWLQTIMNCSMLHLVPLLLCLSAQALGYCDERQRAAAAAASEEELINPSEFSHHQASTRLRSISSLYVPSLASFAQSRYNEYHPNSKGAGTMPSSSSISSFVKQTAHPAPAPRASHRRHHRKRHHHKASHSPPPPPLYRWRLSPPPLSEPPLPSAPMSRRFPPPPAQHRGRLSPPQNGLPPSPLYQHSNASAHLPSGNAAGSISPAAPPLSPRAPYPPSPPNEDCDAIVCLPPLTKTPFMSPCGCVRPIQVKMDLSVPLYSLFPLISVLAANIAEGAVLSPSQVQITGASADSEDPGSSIVDVNLVPLDQAFDNLTALLIFQRFWNHELILNASLFGDYRIIYVHYPGLPSSPPIQPGDPGKSATNGDSKQNPVGVDVNKKRQRRNDWVITAIALSSAIVFLAFLGCFWLLCFKIPRNGVKASSTEPGRMSIRTFKRSGGRSALSSELLSSTSMSFASSMATYSSTAKSFTIAELERATGNFRPENVIGEGGFGRVYYGTLDDGQKVAVKVLTRDEGGREFIAEVETLSCLHHRNLVKLIGICTEDHNRCLVYEFIANGSVESHLHGVHKGTSPLDWETRMKIALGAARGLAYLHEDSNPRVIHRDFKASNILLENDFTPKVSDFGLAKMAPNEDREYLSTRVMGTFGYVAPEYAMTGHLRVESDVYSYGVVLLELLTGRKPVDMSQPPGQANLVTWARPLLTNKEGLELLVDPDLGNDYPRDSLSRVAAIASMCVQHEASQRPFMGEVVQALKLVYNDSDAQNGFGSSNASQECDSLAEGESRGQLDGCWFHQKKEYMPDSTSFISAGYHPATANAETSDVVRPLSFSVSAFFPNARSLIGDPSSLRRHSLSGPLRSKRAGYKLKATNRKGSVSEHASLAQHFGTGFDRDLSQILP